MYECHITLELTNIAYIEELIESMGWKFSKIDGDPVLGEGVKCYATAHFNASKNVSEVIEEMSHVAGSLHVCGYKVIRQKVELIVYDTKRKKD